MKDFMFIFRNVPSATEPSPEEMQANMQLWMNWIDELKKQDRYKDGEPLTPPGKTVKGDCSQRNTCNLCRVFTESIGRSPMETVRLARLDRAMDLIARSNYSVGQIAELCGFASAFHFSRRFKDAFGQSPKALRTAIRNGAAPPTSKMMLRFGETPVR